jgi:hypothetical protein
VGVARVDISGCSQKSLDGGQISTRDRVSPLMGHVTGLDLYQSVGR